MKIWNFICILFSLAFLFSCSDENLTSGNLSKGEFLAKTYDSNNRIDMAEATNLVEEAIAFLDKEHPSESKSSRSVNSVSILRFGDLKSSIMKSDEYRGLDISDTLAYVFNFGDSLGYVIISNDIRVESPLLAFTKKGSLVNGETDNPGLKIFLERLEGYILESIAKSGKADNQKEVAEVQKGPYLGALDTIVKPLIPVEWGQGAPFNNNLKNDNCYGNGTANNGKVWAGCVATATAQIMSYWKYPTYMSGSSYNWNILTKYKHKIDFYSSSSEATIARNSVADLFQRIGNGVSMNYGCYKSTTPSELALYFLEYFYGFSHTDFKPYTFNIIRNGLIALKAPSMAKGCDATDPNNCHAWVIDGIARIHSSNSYFIHNNWGWDGNHNGYYESGVFDPSSYNYQNVYISKVYR